MSAPVTELGASEVEREDASLVWRSLSINIDHKAIAYFVCQNTWREPATD